MTTEQIKLENRTFTVALQLLHLCASAGIPALLLTERGCLSHHTTAMRGLRLRGRATTTYADLCRRGAIKGARLVLQSCHLDPSLLARHCAAEEPFLRTPPCPCLSPLFEVDRVPRRLGRARSEFLAAVAKAFVNALVARDCRASMRVLRLSPKPAAFPSLPP